MFDVGPYVLSQFGVGGQYAHYGPYAVTTRVLRHLRRLRVGLRLLVVWSISILLERTMPTFVPLVYAHLYV